MSLKEYHQKRNFKQTPEPKGKATKDKHPKLRFVVQKHNASHLHYDFRLEASGVLKSWAVPKEPSLNPKERKLAMEVEDHPLEYGNFEGVIPEGNYGAGTVMIWDEGYYEPIIVNENESPEDSVLRHLQDGHLKFRLHGKKLKGEFAIVKIKNNKYSSKNNSWLLIKHSDEAANKVISHKDISVKTGRSMDEIANNSPSKKIEWHDVVQIKDEIIKAKIPRLIKPMLATLGSSAFTNQDWLYELKWDGYRAIAEIVKGKVKLYSRNNLNFNTDYPEIVSQLSAINATVILDGEIVAVDKKGVSRFQLLQSKKKNPGQKIIYYVFDILYFDKFDLRSATLVKRKEILNKIIIPDQVIRISETFEDGVSLFSSAKKLGFEGIIAKKKTSKYVLGRSNEWLKIKALNESEFVLGGYTFPQGTRKGFGSILLGEYEKNKLVFRGHVGTGFDDNTISELKIQMDKHATIKSPFAANPFLERSNVKRWIKPKLVAQVRFSERTKDRILRHPVFIGLRKDKEPAEVTKQTAIHSPFSSSLPEQEFTHMNKIYWPRDNYAKKDLLEYYNSIGDIMLPYLVDRPQNLNRHPNGIDGESFYQKDFDQSHPDFVVQKRIYSKSAKRFIDYVLCQNKETLLFLANLGCIEINAWNSRIDSLDKPDYVLFDLDPVETSFANVVKVAQALREMFGIARIESFCKTSGKRGLHIYIPLQPKYSFEQARMFAELISVKLQEKLPNLISLERDPDKRRGKVYIDYLQNRKGQTTACVYSVRPVDGAAVSTPLKWEEVNSKLNPKNFHIKNILKRIDKVGDLWKDMLGRGISIEKALKSI